MQHVKQKICIFEGINTIVGSEGIYVFTFWIFLYLFIYTSILNPIRLNEIRSKKPFLPYFITFCSFFISHTFLDFIQQDSPPFYDPYHSSRVGYYSCLQNYLWRIDKKANVKTFFFPCWKENENVTPGYS